MASDTDGLAALRRAPTEQDDLAQNLQELKNKVDLLTNSTSSSSSSSSSLSASRTSPPEEQQQKAKQVPPRPKKKEMRRRGHPVWSLFESLKRVEPELARPKKMQLCEMRSDDNVSDEIAFWMQNAGYATQRAQLTWWAQHSGRVGIAAAASHSDLFCATIAVGYEHLVAKSEGGGLIVAMLWDTRVIAIENAVRWLHQRAEQIGADEYWLLLANAEQLSRRFEIHSGSMPSPYAQAASWQEAAETTLAGQWPWAANSDLLPSSSSPAYQPDVVTGRGQQDQKQGRLVQPCINGTISDTCAHVLGNTLFHEDALSELNARVLLVTARPEMPCSPLLLRARACIVRLWLPTHALFSAILRDEWRIQCRRATSTKQDAETKQSEQTMHAGSLILGISWGLFCRMMRNENVPEFILRAHAHSLRAQKSLHQQEVGLDACQTRLLVREMFLLQQTEVLKETLRDFAKTKNQSVVVLDHPDHSIRLLVVRRDDESTGLFSTEPSPSPSSASTTTNPTVQNRPKGPRFATVADETAYLLTPVEADQQMKLAAKKAATVAPQLSLLVQALRIIGDIQRPCCTADEFLQLVTWNQINANKLMTRPDSGTLRNETPRLCEMPGANPYRTQLQNFTNNSDQQLSLFSHLNNAIPSSISTSSSLFALESIPSAFWYK